MKHIDILIPPILITKYWEALNQVLLPVGYNDDCYIFESTKVGIESELLIWYLVNILTLEYLHLE